MQALRADTKYLVPGINTVLAMKKLVILLSCFLAVLACNKEQNKEQDVVSDNLQVFERPVITASSEGQVTKATLDAADLSGNCDMLWSLGDQIGVHVYSGTAVGTDNYGTENTSWTLAAADAGKKSGSFSADSPIDGSKNYAYAAYYPFDTHNIGGDARFYCAYKNSYSGYVPGRIISPMVANMNADGLGLERRSTNIALKHVGATVKITLNNVPAEANKLVLTISNNNITGWGSIDPADAGTASIAPSGLSEGGGIAVSHSITLNFANGADARDGLVFYFPVPVLTTPAIQLDLYGYDDVHIWTKSAAKNQPSVGRGEILAMPALTVTPRLVYVLNNDVQSWGSSRNLYVYEGGSHYGPAFPGVWAASSEIISGNSYYKFVLPIEAEGHTCTFVFNKGESGYQVDLPSAMVSSTPLYYRTNGIDVITVADPASPGPLSTAKRIWVWSPDATSIGIHTFDGTATGTSWESVRSMVRSTAQHGSTYWYSYDVPAADQDKTTKMVFRIGYDVNPYSNQTTDVDLITLNKSYYYKTGAAGGDGKYSWTKFDW